MEWLNLHLDHFIPLREGRLTDDGVKAFAELSVVYGYLEQKLRLQHTDNFLKNVNLPVWRAFLIRHFEDKIYAETVRKRPAQAFYLLIPYLVLRGVGYRSQYYEESLQQWRRWGYPQAMEVIPYRLLDQQYILWKAGYQTREPNWQQLYRQTVLGRECSSIYLDENATYSITHTLFYLTDFGNHCPPLEKADLQRIVDLVECLLLHYWRLANWDLVAELLTNLNCLGANSSVIYSGAAEALYNVWRSDGAIPANGNCETELQSFQSVQQPELGELIFRHCYHTTLVGIFYCSTSLNGLKDEHAPTQC